MKIVTAADLAITAPLVILRAETVAPVPPETRIRTYRCGCGFTLDPQASPDLVRLEQCG